MFLVGATDRSVGLRFENSRQPALNRSLPEVVVVLGQSSQIALSSQWVRCDKPESSAANCSVVFGRCRLLEMFGAVHQKFEEPLGHLIIGLARTQWPLLEFITLIFLSKSRTVFSETPTSVMRSKSVHCLSSSLRRDCVMAS